MWHRRQHIDKKELVFLLAQPTHATKHGLIGCESQLGPKLLAHAGIEGEPLGDDTVAHKRKRAFAEHESPRCLRGSPPRIGVPPKQACAHAMQGELEPARGTRAQVVVVAVHDNARDVGPLRLAGKKQREPLVHVEMDRVVVALLEQAAKLLEVGGDATDACTKGDGLDAHLSQTGIIGAGLHFACCHIDNQTRTIHALEQRRDERLDTARFPFLAKKEDAQGPRCLTCVVLAFNRHCDLLAGCLHEVGRFRDCIVRHTSPRAALGML